MNALAWVFGLGALMIAFPFLFHLIRRTPKGMQEFSSLMFLKATPPQLTRRSRLENILLLLLRCAAILLLAFAFMRPFFRTSTPLALSAMPGRTVAVLVDNSASMQRGAIWKDAIAESKKLIGELSPRDSVGLFSFGERLRTICDFPEDDLDSQSASRCAAKLGSLEPTLERSRLGAAVTSLVERLTQKQDEEQGLQSCQIIVVTDFQRSSSLELLQSEQWPANVKLSVVPIESDSNNASLQILNKGQQAEGEAREQIRVRIRNFATDEPATDQFTVAFDSDSVELEPLKHYVPSEESRIVRLNAAAAMEASFVSLSGDQCEFDNRFYFVSPQPQTHRVLYLGNDTQPDGLRYYLNRALAGTPLRTIEIVDANEIGSDRPSIVFVTQPLDEAHQRQVQSYLDEGVLVVFVLDRPEMVAACGKWIGVDEQDEAEDESDEGVPARRRKNDYHLLADIEFADSMFAKFDSPRFSDFTKIKFWQRANVSLDQANCNVVARFDDETPAIWRPNPEKGKVVCFAFGWQPQNSQFALSTKFVPMMKQLLLEGIDQPAPVRNCLVSQSVSLDPRWQSVAVIKPDGSKVEIDSQSNGTFSETDLLGVYSIESEGAVVQQFAVNLDPAESDTNLMELEELEALGVVTGEQVTAEEQNRIMRTMEDARLESQQKIWKWAIVATIGLLIFETLWSGRRSTAGSPASSTGTDSPATASAHS